MGLCFNSLPDEILELVLLNLDHDSIYNFARSNRKGLSFYNSDIFWFRRLQRQYRNGFFIDKRFTMIKNFLRFSSVASMSGNSCYNYDLYNMMRRSLEISSFDPIYSENIKNWILSRNNEIIDKISELSSQGLLLSSRQEKIDKIKLFIGYNKFECDGKGNDINLQNFLIVVWWCNRFNNGELISTLIDDMKIIPGFYDIEDYLDNAIDLVLKSKEKMTTLIKSFIDVDIDMIEMHEEGKLDYLIIDAAIYNNEFVMNDLSERVSHNLIDRMIECEVEHHIYLRLDKYYPILKNLKYRLNEYERNKEYRKFYRITDRSSYVKQLYSLIPN